VVPQDSQNCGQDFAKCKQLDAECAGNSLLCMVIIDLVIGTLLGRLTLDLAGMQCPSWDEAFVSSCFFLSFPVCSKKWKKSLHSVYNLVFLPCSLPE